MCVFCKIINKEFSSYKIYETNNVLAILDISQATYGHTLVMPKLHVENIFEISDDLLKEVYSVVGIICKHYKKVLPNLKGINLLNNNGEKAGQTVNHYHIHIIPRYNDDDLIDIKFTDHSKFLNLQEIEKLLKL